MCFAAPVAGGTYERRRMNWKYIRLDARELFRWYETLIADFVAGLEGSPLREGKLDYYKQEFLKVFLVHLAAIRSLHPTVEVAYKGAVSEVSSLPSVLALLRSALETHALFHYIYIDPSEPEVVRFRFWSWWREGLIRRQSLPPLTPEVREKQQQELETINRIAREHKTTQAYQTLTAKQQERYAKHGTWCFLSKSSLLHKAGFNVTFASTLYGHLSAHVHASSGGLLQCGQADYDAASQMAATIFQGLFVSCGLFVQSYLRLFPQLGTRVSQNDRSFCATWAGLGALLLAKPIP